MLAGTATQSAAVLPCRDMLLLGLGFPLLLPAFLRRLDGRLCHIHIVQTGQQVIHCLLAWLCFVRRGQCVSGGQMAVDAEQVTRCYLSVKAQHQLDFFDRLNSVPIRVLSYCKCVEKSLP